MNSTLIRHGDRPVMEMEPHEIFQALARLQPQNYLFWAKSYVKWKKTPSGKGAHQKRYPNYTRLEAEKLWKA